MSTAPETTPYPPGLALALDHETIGDAPSTSIPLQVKLHHKSAKAPTRGSKHAAGYDIYVCEDAVVPKFGKAMLSTGISIAIPPGTYARIAPRSGLAAKHSLATGAGVIDYDYRGEVKVIIFNHSDTDFQVAAGDRMAQLILERIVTPEVVVVEELEGTDRGAGGFGSTGGFGPAALTVPAEEAPELNGIAPTGPEALAEDLTAGELTAATMGGI